MIRHSNTTVLTILTSLVAAILLVGVAHFARASDPEHTALPSRDPGVALTPPTDLERVIEARDLWAEDDEFRRAWLFRPSREVLAEFGSPSRVFAGKGGDEVWQYEDEQPDYTDMVWLRLIRDRLIHIE